MIEGITITAGGEDIAAEQQRALTSGTLTNIIGYRIGQIAKGHTEAADDAIGYLEMLAHVGPHFLAPMRERTTGTITGTMLRAAAKAAEKLAALCWAFADKIKRDPRSQLED
jgi:hypothetical protein